MNKRKSSRAKKNKAAPVATVAAAPAPGLTVSEPAQAPALPEPSSAWDEPESIDDASAQTTAALAEIALAPPRDDEVVVRSPAREAERPRVDARARTAVALSFKATAIAATVYRKAPLMTALTLPEPSSDVVDRLAEECGDDLVRFMAWVGIDGDSAKYVGLAIAHLDMFKQCVDEIDRRKRPPEG